MGQVSCGVLFNDRRPWRGCRPGRGRSVLQEHPRVPACAQADWITKRLGISAQAIREDRILHEAHATRGDVRRLIDLFGLSVEGAQRYTATVDHPAIRSLEPRAGGAP